MSIAHVLAEYHLLIETEQNEEDFDNTYSIDNIIDSKVKIILPDGNTIKAKFAALQKWEKIDFMNKKKTHPEK